MNERNINLVKIALYYYKDGLTQGEIAKKMGISRPTVSNMLNEARDKGIVNITIHTHMLNTFKHEDLISKKFGLKSIQIVESLEDSELTKEEIGHLSAQFIEKKLPTINSLGIGWGTTMQKYVEAASYLNYPKLSVFPLMGGVSLSDIKNHSNHLVFTLGEKYNAKTDLLYAPAIAENMEVKNILSRSNMVQTILNKGKNVDLAVIGIGNPIESHSYRQMGYISNEEIVELTNQNAIGDILATFFNENGNVVKTTISNRMIGQSLDDIKKMREILIIASGAEKSISIKALLRQKFIDHLIIDSDIAKKLIQ